MHVLCASCDFSHIDCIYCCNVLHSSPRQISLWNSEVDSVPVAHLQYDCQKCRLMFVIALAYRKTTFGQIYVFENEFCLKTKLLHY